MCHACYNITLSVGRDGTILEAGGFSIAGEIVLHKPLRCVHHVMLATAAD